MKLNESAIRGSFSLLAAAVTLAMSSEWARWALDERRYWKILPAGFLAVLAIFETSQVWRRAEQLIFRSDNEVLKSWGLNE